MVCGLPSAHELYSDRRHVYGGKNQIYLYLCWNFLRQLSSENRSKNQFLSCTCINSFSVIRIQFQYKILKLLLHFKFHYFCILSCKLSLYLKPRIRVIFPAPSESHWSFKHLEFSFLCIHLQRNSKPSRFNCQRNSKRLISSANCTYSLDVSEGPLLYLWKPYVLTYREYAQPRQWLTQR